MRHDSRSLVRTLIVVNHDIERALLELLGGAYGASADALIRDGIPLSALDKLIAGLWAGYPSIELRLKLVTAHSSPKPTSAKVINHVTYRKLLR